MQTILNIILLFVVLVLIVLYVKTKNKLKAFSVDNVKLINSSASFRKKNIILRKLLAKLYKKLTYEIIPIAVDKFYFKATDKDLNPIDIEAIRFKRKDNKVFIYLNGAMVPTEDSIFILNPILFDKELLDILQLEEIVNKEDLILPSYTALLNDLND